MKKILAVFFALFLHIVPAEAAASIPVEAMQGLITNDILSENGTLSYQEAKDIADRIVYHAYTNGVDPLLAAALFSSESMYHQEAVSSLKGTVGIGQLLPDVYSSMGMNPYDLDDNIRGSCIYLADRIKEFSSRENPAETAIAAYEIGIQSVADSTVIPQEAWPILNRVHEKYSRLDEMLKRNNVMPPVWAQQAEEKKAQTEKDNAESNGSQKEIYEILDIEDY